MTIKERIQQINSLTQDECWYITKQPLKFNELCFAAKILEDFLLQSTEPNYETFFVRLAPTYGISPNHRMTNNCYYVGLLNNNGQYKDATVSDAYLAIKSRCNGDFNRTDLYEDLIVSQIEKVFISNPVDREQNGLRINFKIHPAYFLAKVIITLSEQTNDYSISLSEFYRFVGSSYNYYYYLSTVDLILESRDNAGDYYNDLQNISTDNFSGNRIHLLLANLPYFELTGSTISLKPAFKNELKQKLVNYECNIIDEYFTTNYLNSNRSLFQVGAKPSPASLQKEEYHRIFFGSPGTGKSTKVKLLTNNNFVIRTTFHPETDYYSFVGSYKPKMNGSNIEYSYTPQSFVKAYCKAWSNLEEKVFLVIEEINRGNCSQIMGDIFQCLDRDINGFSEYEIDIDNDLALFLKNYFENVFTQQELENYNLITKSELGLFNKISLPNNLFIYATMNTSDQSLFPMDSAFKRRWDWEFIPIDYSDAQTLKIKIDDNTFYNYGTFIKCINPKIKELTGSEDKQLGNRFISPTNSTISFEQFRSKLLFYLWSEVYKDEVGSANTIFKYKNDNNDDIEFQFGDLFDLSATFKTPEELIMLFMDYNGIPKL